MVGRGYIQVYCPVVGLLQLNGLWRRFPNSTAIREILPSRAILSPFRLEDLVAALQRGVLVSFRLTSGAARWSARLELSVQIACWNVMLTCEE